MAITERHHQRSAAAKVELTVDDLPLDDNLSPRCQISNRSDVGSILIAYRQVEEQIDDPGDFEPCKLGSNRRPNPLKGCDFEI